MPIKTYEYVLPAIYACPLINSDCSGLEDEDITMLDEFIEDIVSVFGSANFTVKADEDPFFEKFHDMWNFPYAAECLTFILMVDE